MALDQARVDRLDEALERHRRRARVGDVAGEVIHDQRLVRQVHARVAVAQAVVHTAITFTGEWRGFRRERTEWKM